jgi:peptide/nickel transport system substrate-binding protein
MDGVRGRSGRSRAWWRLVPRGALFVALLAAGLGALGSGAGDVALASSVEASSSTPHAGGTMTVLESSDAASWATGLDPATNASDLANAPSMDAIYGDLFAQGSGASVVPDLATGYSFSDGARTLTISLRHGVTFQDGTPFNASAVAFNIRRDLEPKLACVCASSFPVSSITTQGNYTVVLHLTKPFSPIIDAFVGEAPDWIASPTALSKMGETAFAKTPVGAGPFEVVSDTYSSVLTLKRFPGYWEKGHPYLNGLVFKSVGSDESGYEAVLANSAQMSENVGTPQLIPEARKQLQVNEVTGRMAVGAVQLNTAVAPFNNIVAREAIYYATDPGAISKALTYGTGTVIQSPSLPGNPFYQQTVPGYRPYDPAKAEALVKQLGGLTVDLGSINGADNALSEALEAQWEQAGMKVDLTVFPTIVPLLQAFKANTWEALTQGAGGINPANGTGGSFWRYYSTGPFSGVHDPALDQLINQAAATTSQAAQVSIYRKINGYLSQQALLPLLYLAPLYNLTAQTAHGPGVSTPLEFPSWPDVWVQ